MEIQRRRTGACLARASAFACLLLAAAAATAATAGPKPVESAAAEQAAPRFDVLEYRVEGNTSLPAVDIERAVYPHLGPEKTVEDVEKARQSLERAYQKAGYLTVLVDIPEQKVESGVVRLRVTEGKVARLRVTGSRYYSAGYIRKSVPELQEGSVPNFPQVQEQLGQLARTPDRKVTPVLRPGETPGTLDVELKVEDELPLHGSLELNNRQTPNTKPLRLSAFLRYDNLWQLGHSISLQYQTAPQETSQLQAYSGSYVLPVDQSGSVLALYAVNSNSDVTALGSTDVIGKGTILGARYVLPFRSMANYYRSLTVGIDHKDFDETVALGADEFETPISYVPVIMEYRLSLTGEQRSHAGSISLNAAPRGFFGNNDEEFESKRIGANSSYVYLRGDWRSEQRLGSTWAVVGRLAGQVASEPLISNEQYAIGGADSVRGYLEAEALGDNGLVGNLELRQALPLLGAFDGWVKSWEGLAFADAGAVRIVDAAPGQTNHYDFYSVGLGLRASGSRYWDAALDLAVPLHDGPETNEGDTRVLFSVAAKF